ncbi:DUF5007 domain-containing protein [Chitinophaga solisilvae]|uniref:DUF5007 domain-containing protein n=1 Tax=Chitinophaga solisilvae TaxID=1233460 RepID=UPI0013713BE5|nr:DUF5007 domain-containing protein [Chitinophaga solisilvae]
MKKHMLRWLLPVMFVLTGCYKELLPKEKDYFSNDAAFNGDEYMVNIGRTNVFIAKFNPNYSTQPLDFIIQQVVHRDGSPAPELLEQVDTWQWKKFYSGQEKTIAEIYDKRIRQKRPVLDIRPNSGDVIFWNTDSSRIKPGLYYFDILVKNNGGQKLFQRRKLYVKRPRPYEPYEFNDDTGERKKDEDGGILHPSLSGVKDDLNNNMNNTDVNVYFRKTGTESNTLTIKFFDKDSLPVKLSRFNLIKWDSLAYTSKITDGPIRFGFNRRMAADSSAVTYDIPNPFPVLADVGSTDERAFISFPYERIAFGSRTKASLAFTFGIFEPGSWEMIFKFKVNPRFKND